MNSCELVSLVTALACSIAKCFPEEELPLLIAMLTQLSDTLTTILAAEELKESREAECKEKLPSKGNPDSNTTTDNNSRNGSIPTQSSSVSFPN
ncbi:MAG: hypothetical protein H6Q59_2504 [Firmicutes bacterium]|nr:hypothetical protein [Bacillota bacterium]